MTTFYKLMPNLLVADVERSLAFYTNVVCFFQAEAGIRDGHVTGVQTCALPICARPVRGAMAAASVLLPVPDKPPIADRKSVVSRKSVDLGCGRTIQNKKPL